MWYSKPANREAPAAGAMPKFSATEQIEGIWSSPTWYRLVGLNTSNYTLPSKIAVKSSNLIPPLVGKYQLTKPTPITIAVIFTVEKQPPNGCPALAVGTPNQRIGRPRSGSYAQIFSNLTNLEGIWSLHPLIWCELLAKQLIRHKCRYPYFLRLTNHSMRPSPGLASDQVSSLWLHCDLNYKNYYIVTSLWRNILKLWP